MNNGITLTILIWRFYDKFTIYDFWLSVTCFTILIIAVLITARRAYVFEYKDPDYAFYVYFSVLIPNLYEFIF